MGDVSVGTLRKLSYILKENRLDFERQTVNCVKDNATETFMHELYYSLSEYANWYVDNYAASGSEDVMTEAKSIFEQIEVVWRPLIEELFPKFVEQGQKKDYVSEEDPGGYNRIFGKPGEKYRSIRYDITENPDYPHLTKATIFERLRSIVSDMPNDGADISRLISLAYKHRLLGRLPYRKSIIRELGMTSSEQSLTELIVDRDDVISYSKRLD